MNALLIAIISVVFFIGVLVGRFTKPQVKKSGELFLERDSDNGKIQGMALGLDIPEEEIIKIHQITLDVKSVRTRN